MKAMTLQTHCDIVRVYQDELSYWLKYLESIKDIQEGLTLN